VDFGGWAGDLITLAADCYNAGIPDSGAYDYGYGLIGNSAGQKSFSGGDMLADVDAMTVGTAVRRDGSLRISDLLGSRYSSVAASSAKYQEFITARFGDLATCATASAGVFTQTSDIPYSTFRAGLWTAHVTSTPIGVAFDLHPTIFTGIAKAFVDAVQEKFIG
jgi:hypothetical protein